MVLELLESNPFFSVTDEEAKVGKKDSLEDFALWGCFKMLNVGEFKYLFTFFEEAVEEAWCVRGSTLFFGKGVLVNKNDFKINA